MSFKYCRAYSWPNHDNNQSLTESYFDKMSDNVETLEASLPCNFAIFLAYEEKDSPFAGIALDMDYHSVADTEISRILDKFKSNLDGPPPSSIENPGWFTTVDSEFESQLVINGISVIKGHYYTGSGAPVALSNGTRVIHAEPTESDIQERIAEILGGESTFFDIADNTEEEVVTEDAVIDEAPASLEEQLHTIISDYSENLNEVERLISEGADINTLVIDETPLMLASRHGHFDLVKTLVESGAVLNLSNSKGCTALTKAAEGGHLEIVRYLISRHSDIDLAAYDADVKTNGHTPLTIASTNGHFDIVKCLLEEGASIHLCGSQNRTALDRAASNGHAEIVKLLLNSGADINLNNGSYKTLMPSLSSSGGTPLISAANWGHTEIVKILLENGADFEKVDDYGKTALSRAKIREQHEVVKFLEEYTNKKSPREIRDTETNAPVMSKPWWKFW